MNVAIRAVFLVLTLLVSADAARAQGPFNGNWELARQASNSRYSTDFAPWSIAPRITQTDDAVVVWTKSGNVLTYTITEPTDETPHPIYHDGRAYTYVAHFYPMVVGGGRLTIRETLVPQPGDAPNVAPTTIVVVSSRSEEMLVLMSGPTLEYPNRLTVLSNATYRRKE